MAYPFASRRAWTRLPRDLTWASTRVVLPLRTMRECLAAVLALPCVGGRANRTFAGRAGVAATRATAGAGRGALPGFAAREDLVAGVAVTVDGAVAAAGAAAADGRAGSAALTRSVAAVSPLRIAARRVRCSAARCFLVGLADDRKPPLAAPSAFFSCDSKADSASRKICSLSRVFESSLACPVARLLAPIGHARDCAICWPACESALHIA